MKTGETYKLTEKALKLFTESVFITIYKKQDKFYVTTEDQIIFKQNLIRIRIIKTTEALIDNYPTQAYLVKIFSADDTKVEYTTCIGANDDSFWIEDDGAPLDAHLHKGEIWNPITKTWSFGLTHTGN